jgi:MFS family permease
MLKQYIDLPRQVHILCLGTLINRAGTFFLLFLTIYLKDKLNLSVERATTTMGLFGLGAIMAALVGGHLADLFGRKMVMVGSMFCGATILVIFTLLTHPIPIMVCVALFSFVSEMYRPATSAMIGDLTTPAQRPAAYSLMYVMINLGFAIGPCIGGWALRYTTFNTLFIADAATSAIYGVIILLAVRETLPVTRPITHDLYVRKVPLAEAARYMARDTKFLLFCAATLAISLTYMQHLSTLPLFLQQFGIDAKQYGLLIAINGAMIVVCQLPLTALLKRFDPRRMICLGSVIVGCGFGLTALAHTQLQFAGTVVVWTLGEMMQLPYLSPIVNDMAPTAMRARYMGLFGVCFSSANMVGAPLGGRIMAHYGGGALWGGCLVLGVVSAILFSIVNRTEPPKPTEETTYAMG